MDDGRMVSYALDGNATDAKVFSVLGNRRAKMITIVSAGGSSMIYFRCGQAVNGVATWKVFTDYMDHIRKIRVEVNVIGPIN